VTPANINLGTLSAGLAEYVYIGEIIIRYTAANWTFTSVSKLTGNRINQTSSPAGSFLSTVATDITIDGNGTPASPLSANTQLTDINKIIPAYRYNQRVLTDLGILDDIEATTKLYLESLSVLNSAVFMWDGVAGVKERTSGVNTFASTIYDMSAQNNDGIQATEAAQPYTAGQIAPNETRKLKGLTGETGTKSVVMSASNAFAATAAFTLILRLKTSSRNQKPRHKRPKRNPKAMVLKGRKPKMTAYRSSKNSLYNI
jgi:hypothetical protein